MDCITIVILAGVACIALGIGAGYWLGANALPPM